METYIAKRGERKGVEERKRREENRARKHSTQEVEITCIQARTQGRVLSWSWS